MKKIILITLTLITVVFLFALNVFAMSEIPYTQVIEFEETKKAYPIAQNLNDTVGFYEYYNVNTTLNFKADHRMFDEGYMEIRASKNIVIISLRFIGSYPFLDYTVENPTQYDDFGIYYYNNTYRLVGINQGVKTEIVDFSTVMDPTGEQFDVFTTTELSEGYYVDFPQTPEEAMNDGIVGTITDTIGGFVKGLGVSFVSAFNALFMVDGHLNSLSIFLLCISGIGLGYGVVRFTTHLFRKET